jgi:hypothetical protein
MPESFGNGVSRTLSALNRQFQAVTWQANKPPLDSELNLMAQVEWERLGNLVRAQAHSGFLADPMQASNDFVTSPDYSNFFRLGNVPVGFQAPAMWANVNGWVIPVTGVAINGVTNQVNLWPPPASDARIDFVFLEVWLTSVAPNPSTVNKPSATTIYKYGNTQFGGVNVVDDIEDPAIGFETTERVQLQYRIRVFGQGTGLGTSVALNVYPDGLDDPSVKAQGTAAAPLPAYSWANMRDVLGDAGLWRAGDGDPENSLGTIDGYSYAIPICAVFRRNTSPFIAQQAAGNANQNGAFDRNPYLAPITDPAEAVRTFSSVTLTASLSATATGVIAVTGLANSGLDNPDLYSGGSVFYLLDGEVVEISGVGAGTITIASRGRLGTQAVPHDAGTMLAFYCFRSDGLFSDQIAPSDILDLRRSITLGEWDYNQLLQHNLGQLFANRLRSSYKQSGISDTEGTVVPEVSYLPATSLSPVPNQTEQVDSPDGIREVFSDAVVVQDNVTVMLLPDSSGGPGTPVSVPDFTAGAPTWETAADFQPSGWQPSGQGIQNGTVINLFIGGASGNDGARKSMGGVRAVRFATPKEMWLESAESKTPFKLRFVGSSTLANDGLFCEPPVTGELSTRHPGPMYPLPQLNFEYPFIVLGGVVENSLRSTSATVVSAATTGDYAEIQFAGVDFSIIGDWWNPLTPLDPNSVSYPVLQGKRTLYDMITKGGTDRSGRSSELYLVLSGDTTNPENCGVFRVIGASDQPRYSSVAGTTVNSIVVEGVQVGWIDFVDAVGLTAEVRSQYSNTEDGPNASVGNAAAAVVVMTDLAGTLGGASNPWRAATLGANAMTFPNASAAILDTSLIYGSGRGAMPRVPDKIDRFSIVNPVSSTYLLRRAVGTIDPAAGSADVPTNEIYYPPQGVQTWSGLSDHGLNAPEGQTFPLGNGRGALIEQLREGEIFADEGSKTLVIRPYRKVGLSVNLRDVNVDGGDTLIPTTYAAGAGAGNQVDDADIFNAALKKGYSLPFEYMPRFGRQDIPVYKYAATDVIAALPYYFGVNHLFADSLVNTDAVFNIIGGTDNGGVAAVNPILFQTSVASGLAYGEYGPIAGGNNAYQSRLYTDINVRSSDLPPGLKGIQLPPFLGVARIYGVYDAREWAGSGAWQADRVTPETGGTPPKNLIRTDADKQTLFIVQGGAIDVTLDENDHTYVIPENLIDIRLSGSFVAGETFEDLDYIVECEVFGFARGFINLNNYVLARKNNGAGAAPSGIAQDIGMVLPLPLPANSCYAAYHRTVYQGDPYMTRGATGQVVSDYEPRFGQTPVANAYEVATSIQQFDANGDQVPEIPNARGLEVLAVADFYTTLGTGKIGGALQSGTMTDIGHLDSSGTRLPTSATANQFQPQPRTFTEGQPESAPRGSLVIRVIEPSVTSAGQLIGITRGTVTVSITSNGSFSGVTIPDTAQSLANYINNSVSSNVPVRAYWNGASDVLLQAINPGVSDILVSLTPVSTNRDVSGFALVAPTGYGPASTSRYLLGGEDVPANATRVSDAPTPIAMTGLTERLPLGILLNDADFIGEDPARSGFSMLHVTPSAGGPAGNVKVPEVLGAEYDRLSGPAGHIGMADGGVLLYTAWTTVTPTGSRFFRVYRGCSAYVIGGQNPGGPVDWASGNLPDGSVLKGCVLAGRAYLVRNYEESAFGDVTSHGDEIQMVIVTRGIVGESLDCENGYALVGQISPTGYGEGYSAADRYRLEGKPLHAGTSKNGPNPVVPLAPYPTDDPQPATPC